jgi:predicted site-specific integrase-resolvase
MAKSRKSAKAQVSDAKLSGWKAIGEYLGIGAATAQRWAKSGMPVRREGRYTVADPEEVRRWLGREAHMSAPALVATDDTDMASALKQSISAVRRQKRKG